MDDARTPADAETIITKEIDLRALHDAPAERVIKKALPTLDPHCRRFIELSPYMCLATSDDSGRIDISPRGDGPGFVTVVNDKTLLVPDRRGNNRLDSLSNIIKNPSLSLLFLIPGFTETVRVVGRGEIVRSQALSSAHIVNGKAPKLFIRVSISEVYFHCGKAAIRAKLWDPSQQADRSLMPGLGTIVKEQIEHRSLTADESKEADDFIEERYRTTLY